MVSALGVCILLLAIARNQGFFTGARRHHQLRTNQYQNSPHLALNGGSTSSSSFNSMAMKKSDHETEIANMDKSAKDVYTIRVLTRDDQEIVWKMLMYASHETSVESVQSQHPILTQYAAGFGHQDKDFGVVAILSKDQNGSSAKSVAIGAAWVRLLPTGYAFVDGDTPELAIAVIPEMRSRGVGSHLLSTLLERLRNAAQTGSFAATATATTPVLPAISLSCRLENQGALRVYERLGFVAIPSSIITNVRSGGQSVSMVHRLDDGVVIRQAQPKDVAVVLDLIQKKSEFDRSIGAFDGELDVTEERLLETVLLNKTASSGSPPPYAQIWLAERANYFPSEQTTMLVDDTKEEQKQKTLGFACFHFRYSSFSGRPSIWLDDLFIESKYRNLGIGGIIMSELAQFANKVHHATHIGWTADARNVRGLSFYAGLGAIITEQHGNDCILKWRPPITAETVEADNAGSPE